MLIALFLVLPYTYKFSRDVNFADVTNSVFSRFYFEDHPIKQFHVFLFTTWLHMAKDITYYFKQCSKFDISKLLPDVSQSTIVAMENEVKAVVCSNESVTTSETTPAAANRMKSNRLNVSADLTHCLQYCHHVV